MKYDKNRSVSILYPIYYQEKEWNTSRNSPNRGNLRETFFFNQLQVLHAVTLPKPGDFMLNQTYVLEIGGAHKGGQQLLGIPNAFIAADDIKTGSGTKIPLWLFGFLY